MKLFALLLLAIGSQFDCLSANLLAHWSFNSPIPMPASDTFQLKPGGNVQFAPSPYGTAAIFHGQRYPLTNPQEFSHPDLDRLDTVAALDNKHFTNGFSVSAWIKPYRIRAGSIVEHDSSGVSLDYLGWGFKNYGALELSLRGRGDLRLLAVAQTPLLPGRWHHVAATWDGSLDGGIVLYVNGKEISSKFIQIPGSFQGLTGEALPIRIGASMGDAEGSVTEFDGAIAEVSLYSGALSGAEVSALFSKLSPFLAEGLVGHYLLNGNARDESPSRNHGVVFEAETASDRFGRPGQSFRFNGVSSFIQGSAEPFPTLEATYSMWLWAEISPPGRGIVPLAHGGSGCGTSSFIALYEWGMHLGHHCGIENVMTSRSLPTNRWVHLTVTVEELRTTFYVDGKIDAIVEVSPVQVHNTGRAFTIGTAVGGHGVAPYADENIGYFKGLIDDVRIYNRALKAREVNQIFHIERPRLAEEGIVEISIPPNTQAPGSRPSIDDAWSVSAPPGGMLDVTRGVGILIDPAISNHNDQRDFGLHQNDGMPPSTPYIASQVPNPESAEVTYGFTSAEVVSGVEIVQHYNGITRVEGFLGPAGGILVSLGEVFGPAGDVAAGASVGDEGVSHIFWFGNSNIAGEEFKLIVRKTSYPTAFATHRIFPLDSLTNRIAAAIGSPRLSISPLPEDRIQLDAMGAPFSTHELQWSEIIPDGLWKTFSILEADHLGGSRTTLESGSNARFYRLRKVP